ncbi:hypothetical protein Fmac_007561 [Flemingia macrophylla]|uniref:Isopenicillin N synthase-like Fe(2+) 2OG dioxygenase domain-containing protein n=1 Tax=Flemingia macrophylla TaxID=520843 RepID=A0ABD1MUX4_9FABA
MAQQMLQSTLRDLLCHVSQFLLRDMEDPIPPPLLRDQTLFNLPPPFHLLVHLVSDFRYGDRGGYSGLVSQKLCETKLDMSRRDGLRDLYWVTQFRNPICASTCPSTSACNPSTSRAGRHVEEFGDNGPFTPIKYGTSYYPQAEKVHYWRDYLKVITFPEFNFSHKPPGYKCYCREVAYDYSKKIRGVARKLLEGISESLGLESNTIIESTGFDSGFQLFLANIYPPCPQPHLALGMLPHSDHCFLTLLTQNGVGGLQVVSNGRYESVLHRAVLNKKETRISLVVANGPALDKEIGPAPELLEKEKPLFKIFKYRDYYEVQQRTRFADKSGLDEIRLSAQQG